MVSLVSSTDSSYSLRNEAGDRGKKKKLEHKAAGKAWTLEEEKILKSHDPTKKIFDDVIPLLPGRSALAIVNRYRIIRNVNEGSWNEEELSKLKELAKSKFRHDRCIDWVKIGRKLRRHPNDCHLTFTRVQNPSTQNKSKPSHKRKFQEIDETAKKSLPKDEPRQKYKSESSLLDNISLGSERSFLVSFPFPKSSSVTEDEDFNNLMSVNDVVKLFDKQESAEIG